MSFWLYIIFPEKKGHHKPFGMVMLLLGAKDFSLKLCHEIGALRDSLSHDDSVVELRTAPQAPIPSPRWAIPTQQQLFISHFCSNLSFKMERPRKSLTLNSFVSSFSISYFSAWWNVICLITKLSMYSRGHQPQLCIRPQSKFWRQSPSIQVLHSWAWSIYQWFSGPIMQMVFKTHVPWKPLSIEGLC